MKRFLTVTVLVASLALGGCATFQQVSTGISVVTKSITNPVTRQDEAKVEIGLDAVVKALLVYKRACVAGAADKNCKSNVTQIQVYTQKIGPLKNQLRGFVDKNDQINATVVYGQLTALYGNLKAFATDVGIYTGS